MEEPSTRPTPRQARKPQVTAPATEKESWPPALEAACSFPDGETRNLYAVDLSLAGTFLMAMGVPRVGSRVQVVLSPGGAPPLRPIDARVTEAVLDPTDAHRCGFRVLFLALDDEMLSAIAALESSRRGGEFASHHLWRAERRDFPRVSTHLVGVAEIVDEEVQIRVEDVSMNGARISLADRHAAAPQGLDPGARVVLRVVDPAIPEHLILAGRVVRVSGCDGPMSFAVRFDPPDAEDARRLEGLILDALVSLSTVW